MIKRVSRKIFRISFLVSFCAHGILSSQSTDTQPPQGIQSSSEHIWSISGDSPDFARENIRKVMEKDKPTPKIVDNTSTMENDSTDWDMGWDIDFETTNNNDLQTFFPVATEDSGTCEVNDFCTQGEQNTPTATTPKKEPNNLFVLDTEHGISTSSSVSAESKYSRDTNNQQEFVDFDVDGWIEEEFHPQVSGDISNAQKGEPSIYTTEKKKKPQINFEDLEASNSGDKSEPAVQTTNPQQTSLGKKRVSVAPYLPTYDEQKQTPTENRQTLSAKKAPYLKPQTSRPKKGLFGPFRPENVDSQNATNSDTLSKNEGSSHTVNEPRKRPEGIIAQAADDESPLPSGSDELKAPPKTILINFNNVSVIEYIRFISRITNRNFIFDERDLEFNVTIISEEPTTLDNVMTALIQELRINGLQLIEEGNNFIIHKNAKIRAMTPINTDGAPTDVPRETEMITQVFHLNTLSPNQARTILRPMLSTDAIMGIASETRHLIITDLVTNIQRIETLLKSIDAPNSGMVIGQYVVRNAFMDNLIELAEQIMKPIAQDQKLTFVPHPAAKSIFIVSSPFIVERTISVLQHLDNFQGTTRIYDLDDLKFQQIEPPVTPPGLAPDVTPPAGLPPDGAITPTPDRPRPGVPLPPGERPTTPEVDGPSGKWELSTEGNWIFRPGFTPGQEFSPTDLPQGDWLLDPQGNWYFAPAGVRPPFRREGLPPGVPPPPGAEGQRTLLPGEAPKGRWVLDPQGSWIFQLSPEEALKPERLLRKPKVEEELPVGHIDRTKFFIHKLQFRRGEDIVEALANIAVSLQTQGSTNTDLIATIQSAQWLEASNSIIVTGLDKSIEKVKELIEEIDRPLRQVLIEMLVLETALDDSLTYGVSWATKSGGGNTATAQAFVGGASPLISALASSGIGGEGTPSTPDATPIIGTLGYNLGVIGQRLTHNGTQFASLGAMVQAVHTRSDTNVIINPKIITEDNKTAEIFVGVNSPFLSNSIANDEGSIVTTNVEFRDTGTTLRVTPLVGHGDIITLEIEQEVSRTQGEPDVQGGGTADVNLTPTTSINRTSTTVHVPNKHFVIISGMIQEEKIGNNNQFPCLGGIPILGAAFKVKEKDHAKRNLMIFIRPEIVDTAEQLRDVTRRQQEIFKAKNRMKKSWKYEVDEALDFMNIKPPCCDECE